MAQLSKEEMDVLMRMLQEAVTEVDKEETKQEATSEISEAKRKDMDDAMVLIPKIKIGMIENEQLDLKSDIPENTIDFLCYAAEQLQETSSGLTILECCLLRRIKDLLDTDNRYNKIIDVYKAMTETIELYISENKNDEDKEVHGKVVSGLVEKTLEELGEEIGL